MITNEKEYESSLLEYEVLCNRINDLSESEKFRFLQLESDLNMYESLKYSKN